MHIDPDLNPDILEMLSTSDQGATPFSSQRRGIPEADMLTEEEMVREFGRLARKSLREDAMSTQDRYIDARLNSIEDKLQTNLERTRERQDADAAWTKDIITRMERQSEQAEARFEKAGERFEEAERRFDARVGEVLQEMRETRRHVSVMSATTIGVTVGSVIAALAIAATFMAGQMSDQGAWLRDSVNRIEAKVESQAPATSPLTPTETPAE